VSDHACAGHAEERKGRGIRFEAHPGIIEHEDSVEGVLKDGSEFPFSRMKRAGGFPVPSLLLEQGTNMQEGGAPERKEHEEEGGHGEPGIVEAIPEREKQQTDGDCNQSEGADAKPKRERAALAEFVRV